MNRVSCRLRRLYVVHTSHQATLWHNRLFGLGRQVFLCRQKADRVARFLIGRDKIEMRLQVKPELRVDAEPVSKAQRRGPR